MKGLSQNFLGLEPLWRSSVGPCLQEDRSSTSINRWCLSKFQFFYPILFGTRALRLIVPPPTKVAHACVRPLARSNSFGVVPPAYKTGLAGEPIGAWLSIRFGTRTVAVYLL
jgi:hypothetical protein